MSYYTAESEIGNNHFWPLRRVSTHTIHPSDRFFDEFRVVLHAYCRDAYAKYSNVNRGAVKGFLRLPDGNRPEDFSLLHSLTCKNVTCQVYPWLGRWCSQDTTQFHTNLRLYSF